mgnify:CR=1 FL=1
MSHPPNIMSLDPKRLALAIAAAMLCASGSWAAGADKSGPVLNQATVEQDPGKTVYWVLPGPRKLSEKVFGTPANPKRTLGPILEKVEKPPIRQLLKDLPILVAAPQKARKTNEAGSRYTVFAMPTPFSNDGRVVSGSFETTVYDRVTKDQIGPPGKTPDEVALSAQFQDPAGNAYRLEFDHVVQPPFPGYETQGGVLIDGWLHGTTGTGSPLMPKEYTRVAWWGVVHLHINGEKVGTRVAHLMTTEPVRKSDYSLALDEEMPLDEEDRFIPSQDHHTHLIVLPIKPVPGKGPRFAPVPSAFELPNGKKQPFIHMMFEEDDITEWKLGMKQARVQSDVAATHVAASHEAGAAEAAKAAAAQKKTLAASR